MSPPPGPPAASRPTGSQRLVRHFDFEEPENFERLPLDWLPVTHRDGGGPNSLGFPEFNVSSFDFENPHGGQASVLLPTRGGSTRLRLAPGVITCFPATDYMVSASIKTRGLKSARAFVTARLLDQNLAEITGTQARSEPVLSDGRWTESTLTLRGVSPAAAYLQIDLELLQASQFVPTSPDDPVGSHRVQVEDLDGAAYFDDISVYLVPKVTLETARTCNIFTGNEAPVLHATLRDVAREPLEAELTLRDSAGALISHSIALLEPSGRAVTLAPDLKQFGWYEAELDVRAGEATLAGARVAFAWIPTPTEPAPRGDRSTFGVLADDISAPFTTKGLGAELDDLTSALQTGAITIAAWGPESDRAVLNSDLAARRAVIDRLHDRGQEITLSIATAPPEARKANRLAPHDIRACLRGDSGLWSAHVLAAADRFGQRVVRWHVGSASVVSDEPWTASESAGLTAFRDSIQRFVPGPLVSLSQSAAGTGFGGVDRLYRDLPADATDADLGSLATALASASVGDVTLVLRAADRQDGPALVRDAARSLHVLKDRSVRLAIQLPAECSESGELTPRKHATAWAQLVAHVAGRRCVGMMPCGEGNIAILFAPPGLGAAGSAESRGVLIAWSTEDGPPGLTQFLGDGPLTLCDLQGNRSPLRAVNETSRAVHVPLGAAPVFVEGVDAAVASFIASFRIEPELLMASPVEQEAVLVLTNTFNTGLAGRLQVLAPGGVGSVDAQDRAWSVRPQAPTPIAAGAGQEIRTPISLSFTRAADTGRREFVIAAQITTDRSLPPITLRAPVEIGLPDLQMDASARNVAREAGIDTEIIVTIRNTGTRERTLRIECAAPGLPTRQLPVSNLEPGGQAVRKIVLAGVGESLRGKNVRVLVADADDPNRLARTLIIR